MEQRRRNVGQLDRCSSSSRQEASSKRRHQLRGISGEMTYSVGGLNEGVVDRNDLDVVVLDGVAEDDTTDTAKSVDADLDHFDFVVWFEFGFFGF